MVTFASCRSTLSKLVASETHSSRLLPCHSNWRAFTYTPWLPYKWRYQTVYIAYRWVLVLYFLIWLVMAGKQDRDKYFIYLTNWAHLTYNMYLIAAAISSTLKLVQTHCTDSRESSNTPHFRDNLIDEEPDGYWNTSRNHLTWYQMIHWVFFAIGNELAFGVMILYWTLDYDGRDINGVSANTHLLNGILSIVDVWISGIPVNFLHCLYIMLYCAVYSIFSGMYFIVTGANIYPVLDYKSAPGSAVGLYLAVTFLLAPLFHFCVYLMYLGRQWLVYRACSVRQLGGSGPTPSSSLEVPDMGMELINMNNDDD